MPRAAATALLPWWDERLERLDGRALRQCLAPALGSAALVPPLVAVSPALNTAGWALGAGAGSELVGLRRADLAGMLVAIAAGLTAWVAAERVVTPLGALTRAVAQIAEGRADGPVPRGEVTELAPLGAAVEMMAATIAARTAERERLLAAERRQAERALALADATRAPAVVSATPADALAGGAAPQTWL